MILVNITGLLMIEETMISPQEYGEGMSMEEYARVMPGEKYWRERIAREIENEILTECTNTKCKCDIRNSVLKLAVDIARGEK